MEKFSIGLDLGGTDLKAGLVAAGGRIERFLKRPSGTTMSAAATVETIAAAYRELTADAAGTVAGVAIGIPGVVDPETGAIRP